MLGGGLKMNSIILKSGFDSDFQKKKEKPIDTFFEKGNTITIEIYCDFVKFLDNNVSKGGLLSVQS